MTKPLNTIGCALLLAALSMLGTGCCTTKGPPPPRNDRVIIDTQTGSACIDGERVEWNNQTRRTRPLPPPIVVPSPPPGQNAVGY